MKHILNSTLFVSVLGFLGLNAQVVVDVNPNTNTGNFAKINKVQYYSHTTQSTYWQNAEAVGVTDAALDRVDLVRVEATKPASLGGGPVVLDYFNFEGVEIRNINLTTATVGVGIWSEGVKTPIFNNLTNWRDKVKEKLMTGNIRSKIYYDPDPTLGPLPCNTQPPACTTPDFDIQFGYGFESSDYMLVAERFGNSTFSLYALDAYGNQIGDIVCFGCSGGGSYQKYDWNSGLAAANYVNNQAMTFTVIPVSLFNTGAQTIFGLRIFNSTDQADVKFFGLSDNTFTNNPVNPTVTGLEGTIFNDSNGLTDATVNGVGIDAIGATDLWVNLLNNAGTVLASRRPNDDGTFAFFDLTTASYKVSLSTSKGTVGQPGPSTTLNGNWVNVGENVGNGAGNDGTPDGVVNVTVTSGAVTSHVNLGVNEVLPGGLSGKVFNDTDGDSDVDGTAIYNPASTQLYATLLDNSNALVNSVAVANDGTYSFSGLSAGSYSVVITTVLNGTIASLPANWINTGENVGLVGNDGTANGLVSASVTAGNTTTNVNFGIRENLGGISGKVFNDTDGDSDVDGTAIYNPASTQLYATLLDNSNALVNSVAVANDGTYSFSGLSAGSYSVVITTVLNGTTASLPANWINTGENVGLVGNDGTANGLVSASVTAGNTTSNVNFGIRENLGGLSGNVYHDVNGLGDATINGSGIGNLNGSPIFVNVVNGGNLVVASMPIGNDGTYSFNDLNPATYSVRLSNSIGVVDQMAPTFTLPADWVIVGENVGSAAGNDGTPDGILSGVIVSLGATTLDVNFGLKQNATGLSGNVFNDANGLSDNIINGNGIQIVDLTQLHLNLTDATNLVVATMPVGADGSYSFTGLVAGSYTVHLALSAGIIGQASAALTLPGNWVIVGENVGNAAGNDGTPDGKLNATVSLGSVTTEVNFGLREESSGLSGNVYNDANALTDNLINGVGISNPSTTQLYVNIANGSNLTVAVATVLNDGTWSVSGLSAGSYTAILSAVAGTLGQAVPSASLPSNWVNTGERVGVNPGHDGNVDGGLSATVAINSVTTNVNFGIQELPFAGTAAAAVQPNPGGTISVSVPATLFSGTDNDGTVTSIRLSGFPTNANTVNIGGTPYNSGNWPVNGITLSTDASGQPLSLIEVDPIDGTVMVVFPYYSIDNGIGESVLPGSATLPFDASGGDIVNYFPAIGFNSFVAEDMWPYQGDYDVNDLVIDYQFKITTNASNSLKEVEATFILRAVGAEFKNGFGFQFNTDVIDQADVVSATGSNLTAGYVTLAPNGLEAGQSKPTFILYDNSFDVMPFPGGVGVGINTNPENPVVAPVTMVATFTFTPGKYTMFDLNIQNFNPFLISNQTRGREVHLPFYSPTDLADVGMLGETADPSSARFQRWYVNNKNHPWALNIPGTFDYPKEQVNIIDAYPKFKDWAESGGSLFPDWYTDLPGYRAGGNIYNVVVTGGGNGTGNNGKMGRINLETETKQSKPITK